MSLNLRFFEMPNAKAEFTYWIKMPDWSLEEIVALSLGKDPRCVSSEKFDDGTRGNEFSTAYFSRLEIARSHHQAGELEERTRPTRVIEWAEEYDFPLPQELIELVRRVEQRRIKRRELQVGGLEVSAPEQGMRTQTNTADALSAEEVPTLTVHAEGASAKTRQVSARNEKLLDMREQQNLQLLVAAMAIKSYKYDRQAAKNDATQKIIKHLNMLGVSLGKATVLKHIRSSISVLDERADPKT